MDSYMSHWRALVAFLATAGALHAQTFPFHRVSRESIGATGQVATADSKVLGFSPDGRWLLFATAASNLVPNDTNNAEDLFLRDRLTGAIQRVNVRADGSQTSSVVDDGMCTPDGRFVAYTNGDTIVLPDSGYFDVFVLDRTTGFVTRESSTPAGASGQGNSYLSGLSADGRWCTFTSYAADLVPGDTNGAVDVFLRDRMLGTTVCISQVGGVPVGTFGGLGGLVGSLSADGNRIVFSSSASTLVPGDTNQVTDVFLVDRAAQTLVRVDVNAQGGQANQACRGALVSPDGSFALFESRASNLVPGDTNQDWDVFKCDIESGALEMLRVGPNSNDEIDIDYCNVSADGRYLGFLSSATDVVPGKTTGWRDVFVLDLQTHAVLRRSLGAAGNEGNADCQGRPLLSSRAAQVAYTSGADNLIPNDGNTLKDVFLSDVEPAPLVYCTAKTNSRGCVSTLTTTGTMSLSTAAPFVIGATNILSRSNGLLAYSTLGRAQTPFQGGYLCVQTPLRRAPMLDSGGNAPTASDCSGQFSFDFKAYALSGAHPALVAGRGVWATFWSRDPGFAFPNNTNLTAGLEFALLP